jgi:hypothetical protein
MLYLGGNTTTISGTRYGGSVRLASPATGAYTWQTGLPCAVEGTPSLDAAGVLAAGTYDFTNCAPQGAYLLNAATGAILIALPVGSAKVFAQPPFAQQTLFIATETNGLYDFAPNPGPPQDRRPRLRNDVPFQSGGLPQLDPIALRIGDPAEPADALHALRFFGHLRSLGTQLREHRIQVADPEVEHRLLGAGAEVVGFGLERREHRRTGSLMPQAVLIGVQA